MKSAEQWSLEFGYNGSAAFVECIKRIQRDALKHAAAVSVKRGEQLGHYAEQMSPTELMQQEGCYLCEEAIVKEMKTI